MAQNVITAKDTVVKQILEFLKSKYLSIVNVCFFMQQIRLLLEINNLKNKYKITNHYCNWLLHKELDKSSSPQIMAEISDSLRNFKTKNELIKNISNTLSLKKLVTEINEILWLNIEEKKVLVNSLIYNNEYWLCFIRIIMSQISYRPLLLKSGNNTIEDLKFSIYGIQIVNGKNNQLYIELLSTELNEKNKKILFEIVLYEEN